MDYYDYLQNRDKVIEKLNQIDILAEMKDIREDMDYFMNRLEAKYPYKTDKVNSLFEAFSREDFDDYLHKRYKNKELYTNETTIIEMIKRI